MDSEDTSHTLINFIDHTRKLDESRGQNFAETCPEINEFIQQWNATCGYLHRHKTFSHETYAVCV